MKRFFILLVFSLAGVCSFAQGSYEPTTVWPYIYKDFSLGEIQRGNGTVKEAYVNIHIAEGRLHFIDGEYIREASPADVAVVTIDSYVYANVGGRMMRVLKGDDNGFVALDTSIDYVKLNSTGGAYGSSSSTLSTQASSSLEGITGVLNMNYMEMKNKMDGGKTLPVLEKMFVVVLPHYAYAGKKDILEMDGIDKEAMKEFLKVNKIKWNDPQSLMQIVDFLAR